VLGFGSMVLRSSSNLACTTLAIMAAGTLLGIPV
jgi:hypothetical protein